jgi:hypothetical protein
MSRLRAAAGASGFKVVQFTDLHFARDAAANAVSERIMRDIVAWERPDLVVYSGDLVSADEYRKTDRSEPFADWFSARWLAALRPLNGTGVPHAVALGNHDVRGAWGAERILELELSQPGSATRRNDALPGDAGAFNYWLDVELPGGGGGGGGGGGDSLRRIWFLNSGDDSCYGVPKWGCVSLPALTWASAAARAAGAPRAGALAFVHIPLRQLQPAQLQQRSGVQREPVSCPALDTGAAAWARAAGVTGIFSGHDHANDYSGVTQEGLHLAYGRYSGAGGYQVPGLARGARVVELRADAGPPGFRTWLRLEDGSVLSGEGRAWEPYAGPQRSPRGALAPGALALLAIALLCAAALCALLALLRRCRGARAHAKAAAERLAYEPVRQPLLESECSAVVDVCRDGPCWPGPRTAAEGHV